jgi:hypothetical protein
MEATGGVQCNLYFRRRDKECVRDIYVLASVNVELSGIVKPGKPEEKCGKHPEGERNTVQ